MRLSSAVLSMFVLVVSVTASADQFPYKGYVSASDVYVRSGPGKNYYPTERLQRGEEVEIWRHDPGGWYAIRPPEGSFSWVDGRVLRAVEDNLAEVVKDKVVAYVGSSFSDVHDVRQVELNAGEMVEIIGEKRIASQGGGVTEVWYKIAPPSGEFRWVFGRFINQKGIPDTVAEKASPERGARRISSRPADKRASRASHNDRVDDQPESHDSHAEPPKVRSWKKFALVPIDENGTPQWTDAQRQKVALAGHGSPNKGHQVSLHGHMHDEAVTATAHEHPFASESYDGTVDAMASASALSKVDRLNNELSLMVAEPPAQWQFDTLRTRVEVEIKHAQSALERGRARALLREIDRYENLKSRYAAAESIRNKTDRSNQLAGLAARRPELPEIVPTTTSAPDLSRFHNVGRLTPVVSRRAGAPRFALTDDKGDVVVFLTPAPGLDLLPQVGKIVGVNGTRGYMPQLKRPHLTVHSAESINAPVEIASKRQP